MIVNGADRIRESDLCVLLEGEHDFGCAVPAGSDVFCHEARLCAGWLCGLDGASETKVADLEIAVGVEEEIRGLEISVYDISGVEGLECSQGLIDKVLGVIVREILCPNDAVHVGLHELLDHWTSGGWVRWDRRERKRERGTETDSRLP